MSKVALIYSFEESNWFSCVKIVGNLLKSYQKLKNVELKPINFGEKSLDTSLRSVAQEIVDQSVDKIVFLDHKPHPYTLVREIYKLAPELKAEMVFHVYGDFTLHFLKWKDLDNLLIGKKVKFVCASDSEVKLVQKFMEGKNTFVEKLPFPVNKEEFYLKDKPNDIKKELGLKNNDKMLLYTGRLSLQKNIVELVDIFLRAHANKEIPENTYLFFAGEFDSLGFIFGDVYHHLGEYFRAYDRTFEKYPDSLRSKVRLLGKIDNKSLIDFYNVCDGFVSLSTYHDEDYGMSVAEAGSCGAPLLLTEWGGFKSFALSQNCLMVKTSLEDRGPSFDRKMAYEKLVDLANKSYDREEQAHEFGKYASVESVSLRLATYLEKESEEFKGFNSFLYMLGRIEKFRLGKIFFDESKRMMNRLYFEVYDEYATKD